MILKSMFRILSFLGLRYQSPKRARWSRRPRIAMSKGYKACYSWRPRLRLWTLMVAVALLAILLGIWTWIDARRDHFRSLAKYHRSRITRPVFIEGDRYRMLGNNLDGGATSDKELNWDSWHLKLYIKYDRAVDRPWLPVPPDPDPPYKLSAEGDMSAEGDIPIPRG